MNYLHITRILLDLLMVDIDAIVSYARIASRSIVSTGIVPYILHASITIASSTWQGVKV